MWADTKFKYVKAKKKDGVGGRPEVLKKDGVAGIER